MVEAEDRDRDAGTCGDGSEVRTYPHDGGDRGTYLYLPGSGCWAEWDITLGEPATALWVLGTWKDTADGACGRFVVSVDGVENVTRTNRTACDVVGFDGRLAEPLALDAGEHTIRITAHADEPGPMRIDRFALRRAEPAEPPGGVLRVEGEERAADAGECAPDDESMEVRARSLGAEAPSEGELLWFPNTWCWAEWDVVLEAPARLFLMAEVGRVRDPQCGSWRVSIDGSHWDDTAEDCTEDGLQLVEVGPEPVPAGAHTIGIRSAWTPSWSNGAIDFLEFAGAGSRCRDGLTATANDDASITIRWPPQPTVDSYEVEVASYDEARGVGMADLFHLVGWETDEHVVRQLTPGEVYTVTVRITEDGVDLGPFCPVEVTAIPFAPTELGMLALGAGGPLAYAAARRRR